MGLLCLLPLRSSTTHVMSSGSWILSSAHGVRTGYSCAQKPFDMNHLELEKQFMSQTQVFHDMMYAQLGHAPERSCFRRSCH